MREDVVEVEIVVVGGGLAGVSAAIAAARLGRSVALVNNRPVLGGNSSSEVRVWVCGAACQGRHRFARETGIIGELLIENQFRNPEGNPYFWDLVLLEAVRAEENIRLFLNTDVTQVDADGPESGRRITSATGWMTGSERRIEFRAPMFIDCSGDGLLGHLAGAWYRIGREARSEFGEASAPEHPDQRTLGSTMLFYSTDVGRPVQFIPPEFAVDIASTPIPERRIISTERDGCYNWWIEWGGDLDAVDDNERIRDELWGVIYGVWDYIKNSGRFDADNLTLEWVGSVPGKREYRRFVGDHTLTQNDVLGQVPFEDRVAFGGWSIDLHPTGGVYADAPASQHWLPDGNYHIPFRSLYSANVDNLLVAGRDISASHVAFGSTRVMATCAVVGEAAGTAAALCITTRSSPRELAGARMPQLQRLLLRQDASVLGLPYDDPDDLARSARVSSSSTFVAESVRSDGVLAIERDLAILVPADPAIDGIDLLLDASRPARLTVELYSTGLAQNYVPAALEQSVEVAVPEGAAQWVRIPLDWSPGDPQNAFIVVRAAGADIRWHVADEVVPGVLGFEHVEPPVVTEYPQPLREWRALARRTPCFRLSSTRAYRAENVVGGFARPFGGPQLWASRPLEPERPEWVELEWAEPVPVGEVQVIFDDEVNEHLNNLHRTITPFRSMPAIAREYRVQTRVDGVWTDVAVVRDNHARRRIHPVVGPPVDAVRLQVERTNGAPCAHVVAVRAYEAPLSL